LTSELEDEAEEATAEGRAFLLGHLRVGLVWGSAKGEATTELAAAKGGRGGAEAATKFSGESWLVETPVSIQSNLPPGRMAMIPLGNSLYVENVPMLDAGPRVVLDNDTLAEGTRDD
jgi:hypothetical protein